MRKATGKHRIAGLVYLVAFMFKREVEGHFSLYLNETETRRLLGVPGELYYARNGFLNDYALSFNLPLKTDITEIYFDWLNEQQPGRPDIVMYYSITVTISNLHAMYQPIVSVPSNGTVPTRASGFSITILCTGLLSTDVDIRIQLNISPASSNIIIIDLRRRKPCLRGVQQSRPVVQYRQQAETAEVVVMTTPAVDAVSTSAGMSVFYIAIGCAASVAVVVATIALVCYASFSRSTKRNLSSPSNEKSLENQEEPDSLLGEDNVKTMLSCRGGGLGSVPHTTSTVLSAQ